jgi:hypothetical protein
MGWWWNGECAVSHSNIRPPLEPKLPQKMCNDDIYLLQIILMGLGMGKDERAVGPLTNVNYPSMQLVSTWKQLSFRWIFELKYKLSRIDERIYSHVSMALNHCLGSSVCIQGTHSPA